MLTAVGQRTGSHVTINNKKGIQYRQTTRVGARPSTHSLIRSTHWPGSATQHLIIRHQYNLLSTTHTPSIRRRWRLLLLHLTRIPRHFAGANLPFIVHGHVIGFGQSCFHLRWEEVGFSDCVQSYSVLIEQSSGCEKPVSSTFSRAAVWGTAVHTTSTGMDSGRAIYKLRDMRGKLQVVLAREACR
jgi:hypothetical protein